MFSIQGGAQPPARTFIDSPREGYVRLVQIRDYYTDAHKTYVPDTPRLRRCGADDVMIARYGSSGGSGNDSLGRICRGIEGVYNVALVRADPSQGTDRSFLYYVLQSRYFQDPLKGQSARSVQSGFSKSSISHIHLPLPPLEEQKRIAGVLGAFDDLIETNRRLAQDATGLQRAAFLRATEGLPRVPISEVMQVEMGQSPPGDTYNFDGDGLAFFQGVKDFSDRYPSTRVYCSQPRRIAEPGDLLLAVRAPIGRVNVATERCATGRGLAILRSGLPAIALQSLTAQADLWAAYEDEGTVFSSINRKVISDQRIRWTSDPDFARALEALDELVLDCHEKNSALTRQRDELLPLLMSGKVRVRDVEAAVS